MEIAGVEFYDQSQKIIVTANASGSFTHLISKGEYKYSELESYEFIENNGVIAKGGGVGRAIIGGALFGSTGAIVGAATAKHKQKNVIEDMDVRMTFRVNGVIKTERVELNQTGVLKYGTMAYERCLNKAKQLIDKLDQISQQNASLAKTNQVLEESVTDCKIAPVVDVKAKLLNLKELYEQGLIDEGEYKEEKKAVLASNRNTAISSSEMPSNETATIGNVGQADENALPQMENVANTDYQSVKKYIKDHFDNSTKIQAIQYYREQTGVGLEEAKNIVEAIFSGRGSDIIIRNGNDTGCESLGIFSVSVVGNPQNKQKQMLDEFRRIISEIQDIAWGKCTSNEGENQNELLEMMQEECLIRLNKIDNIFIATKAVHEKMYRCAENRLASYLEGDSIVVEIDDALIKRNFTTGFAFGLDAIYIAKKDGIKKLPYTDFKLVKANSTYWFLNGESEYRLIGGSILPREMAAIISWILIRCRIVNGTDYMFTFTFN